MAPKLISEVQAERCPYGEIDLSWRAEVPDLHISVFVGEEPEVPRRRRPVTRVRGACRVKISGLNPKIRHYFEILPQGGEGVVVAERKVYLEGAVNFRDLGGYETKDGRRVRWGRIFRSDHLSRITEVDRILLKRMRLKWVCDFRTPAEVKKSPDSLPRDESVRYLHLPVRHSSMDPADAFEKVKRGDLTWLTRDFLIQNYIESIEKFGRVWGEVLRLAARPENLPLVFHCTGGKDRAGVCAALFLLALGVPEETVIRDHALSDEFNADRLREIYDRVAPFGVEPSQIRPYLTVPRFLMVSMLNHIHESYGSVTQYLERKGGLQDQTIRRLRRLLLE